MKKIKLTKNILKPLFLLTLSISFTGLSNAASPKIPDSPRDINIIADNIRTGDENTHLRLVTGGILIWKKNDPNRIIFLPKYRYNKEFVKKVRPSWNYSEEDIKSSKGGVRVPLELINGDVDSDLVEFDLGARTRKNKAKIVAGDYWDIPLTADDGRKIIVFEKGLVILGTGHNKDQFLPFDEKMSIENDDFLYFKSKDPDLKFMKNLVERIKIPRKLISKEVNSAQIDLGDETVTVRLNDPSCTGAMAN